MSGDDEAEIERAHELVKRGLAPDGLPMPGNPNPRRLSGEEVMRRGTEIYERVVAPQLQPEDDGKDLLIDVETEDYEMGHDLLQTARQFYERRPDAQAWGLRVGRPAHLLSPWQVGRASS